MKSGLEFLPVVKSWANVALAKIKKTQTGVSLSQKHVLFPKPKEPKLQERKKQQEKINSLWQIQKKQKLKVKYDAETKRKK